MMVRFTSLALLEKIGDKKSPEKSCTQPSQIIYGIHPLRTSIRMMQHVGLNEYVYPQIKAYVEDNLSERVAFNVSLGLQVFDQATIQAAIDKIMSETYLLQDKEEMRKILENTNNSRSMQKELLNKDTSERWRILYCNSLKNYMAHTCVDGLLALLTDSDESEKLKISLLEALAWFTHSYRKHDILQVCNQLRKDKNLSDSLREEANRTYYRLKN